jgi:hypothetical protein
MEAKQDYEKLVRGYFPDAKLIDFGADGWMVETGWQPQSGSLGGGDTTDEAWKETIDLIELMQQMLVGYFDSTDPNAKPKNDPAPLCVWCMGHVTNSGCRTHSIMWEDRQPPRSYFYRVHKDCQEKYGDADPRIWNLITGGAK